MENPAKPTISVILPVFNGERFLREAIESILTQSFSDFELIIINDGSTDKTEEIILSYNDKRIVHIKNKANLKIIKSLNIGIELAKGKYIARMDADDISLPARFEKQVEIFKSSDRIDIVNSNPYILEENGINYREQKSAIRLSMETISYLIVLHNFICHPAVMIKSDLLKHYKYIDDISKEHIEDFDLWNRMLKDGCVCYTIDQCLLLYRNNNTSINHTQQDKQVEKKCTLCSDMLKERFNAKIDKDCLKIILEDKIPVGFVTISKINNEIFAYNNLIKSNFLKSKATFCEMELWRKQKVIWIALKSVPRNSLIKNFGVLFFLIFHLNWFIGRDIRKFIAKSIYMKNLKWN